MVKIAIVGLGLIGGSIGLGLKQSRTPGLEVVGHDSEMEAGRKAVKRGAVDKAPWRLYEAVEGAQVVFIATPVLAIRDVMENIAGMVAPGCVVTDTGSTKEAVMGWAEEYLPEGVSFVGGHPMAGKETSGIDNAEANLFRGARYVIIPGRGAREEAAKTVIDLAEILGARPFFLNAQEHDSFVASVSHLPILLSAALVSAASKSPSWREISRLAATGFRDVSRLASGDPVMSLDICVTNRESIVYWVDQAIKELEEYRGLVNASADQVGAERLAQAFTKAWEAREKWLARYQSGRDRDDDDSAPKAAIPTMGEQMMDLMVGTRIRERYQQFFAAQERRLREPRPRQPRDNK
ncbi:MAG: prephenate dehydrogenase/arogenate dehydrogenase family protein [Chloroflexi bacterium]|nr:prephenate dehydrogenase/arogenate dehydrogenase family protein [Chloroflexota bacterium]